MQNERTSHHLSESISAPDTPLALRGIRKRNLLGNGAGSVGVLGGGEGRGERDFERGRAGSERWIEGEESDSTSIRGEFVREFGRRGSRITSCVGKIELYREALLARGMTRRYVQDVLCKGQTRLINFRNMQPEIQLPPLKINTNLPLPTAAPHSPSSNTPPPAPRSTTEFLPAPSSLHLDPFVRSTDGDEPREEVPL